MDNDSNVAKGIAINVGIALIYIFAASFLLQEHAGGADIAFTILVIIGLLIHLVVLILLLLKGWVYNDSSRHYALGGLGAVLVIGLIFGTYIGTGHPKYPPSYVIQKEVNTELPPIYADFSPKKPIRYVEGAGDYSDIRLTINPNHTVYFYFHIFPTPESTEKPFLFESIGRWKAVSSDSLELLFTRSKKLDYTAVFNDPNYFKRISDSTFHMRGKQETLMIFGGDLHRIRSEP